MRRAPRPERAALTPAKRQAQPPPDPKFLQTIRMMLKGEPLREPFGQHPWFYAVTQACAVTLASVPFRIYKTVNAKGGPAAWERAIRAEAPAIPRRKAEWISSLRNPRSRFLELRAAAPWLPPSTIIRAVEGAELVEAGEWYELFRKPNATMTKARLWEALWIYLGIDGECFWTFHGQDGKPVKTPTEVPTTIHVWKGGADWDPEIDKAASILKGWKHKPADVAEATRYTLEQVMHWNFFNPYSRLRGLSPFKPVEREVSADYKAAGWNEAFFDNGAQPGGYILAEKPLTAQQEADLIAQFETKHRGWAKNRRPGIFSGGVRFVEAGGSHKDMDFGNLRTFTRDAVFGSARTPRSVLGLNEDVNRASMDRSTRNWWETTLLPRVQYAEDLLDSGLFTDERADDGNIWGAFDLSVVEALREDLTEKLSAGKVLFDLGYTANEINERLELGMGPLAWGNIGYKPTGYEVVGEGNKKAEPKEEPEEKPKPPADDDEEDVEEESGARLLAGTAGAGAVAAMEQLIDTYRRDARARRWNVLLDDLFLPAERALERKFRGFLAALRAKQLQLVEDADLERVTMADQILFNLREQQKEAIRRTAPVYATWFKAAAAGAEAEADAVLPSESVRASEDAEVERVVRELNAQIGLTVKTIRRQLRTLLAEQIAAGATKAELKKTIRAAMNRLVAGGRPASIARNEAGEIISRARDFVFRKKGVPGGEWMTAGDEHVRDTHVAYGKGGAKPLGFNWAELTGGAYMLEFPHDPRAPQEETTGCRCVLFPVGEIPAA